VVQDTIQGLLTSSVCHVQKVITVQMLLLPYQFHVQEVPMLMKEQPLVLHVRLVSMPKWEVSTVHQFLLDSKELMLELILKTLRCAHKGHTQSGEWITVKLVMMVTCVLKEVLSQVLGLTVVQGAHIVLEEFKLNVLLDIMELWREPSVNQLDVLYVHQVTTVKRVLLILSLFHVQREDTVLKEQECSPVQLEHSMISYMVEVLLTVELVQLATIARK